MFFFFNLMFNVMNRPRYEVYALKRINLKRFVIKTDSALSAKLLYVYVKETAKNISKELMNISLTFEIVYKFYGLVNILQLTAFKSKVIRQPH